MASLCKRQQCTIERRGFRQELDSWRHKLIHCVGKLFWYCVCVRVWRGPEAGACHIELCVSFLRGVAEMSTGKHTGAVIFVPLG